MIFYFKVTFVATLLFTYTLSSAQDQCIVALGMNYGSYSMSKAKIFQQEILMQTPFGEKTTSTFPSYFGFEGKLLFKVRRARLGAFASLNSTGSRASYSDYSGSFIYDQRAKVVLFGFASEIRLNQPGLSWDPFFAAQLGFGKSTFTLSDQLIVGGKQILLENESFKSGHVTILPSFGVRKFFLKRFFVSGTLGYAVDLGSQLEQKDGDYLHLKSGDLLTLDWSGVRIGLSTGVGIGKQ